jgi:hypothetical protein
MTMTAATTPICLACRANPSITIIDDGWTPMCAACVDRVGSPIEIGRRAVCHLGSIHGTVVRFDESTWVNSSLAELADDAGTTAWYPLAELAPVA